MVRYFVLVKKTGQKGWLAAVPSRAGTSKTKLQKLKPRKGISTKVVSETELRKLITTILRKNKSKVDILRQRLRKKVIKKKKAKRKVSRKKRRK